MSSKKLSFKLGQEKNRGELYTRHSNAIENTVVSFEEGQALFSYSGINSTKYPYKPYDNTFKRKPSKDARIYIDLSNERIPISSYFSDYSSKLWDLSSGEEFIVGNYFNSIYFNNGQPNRGHGNNVIYCECLDQDVESNIPIRVSLSDGTWLYDENSLFMNEIPDGTIFIIYFCYGAVTGTKKYLQLQFSENSTDKTSIIRAYNFSENYNIPEGAFISYVYLSGDLYQINDSIATTENYGQTKLYDSFDSTATDLAATANSVHKIVNESLLFTGNKTLEGKFLIRTKTLNSVLDSNQNDAFCIYTKNTTNGYTTRLYLDSAGISSTSQANNSNEQFSSLYLNTEGGNLILGPQLLINNNTIQALLKYDEEEPNDLYINQNGGKIYTKQLNINLYDAETNQLYNSGSVSDYLTIGNLNKYYLAIDYQTLQSINNTENDNQLNNLYINPDGGNIYLGGSVSISNDGIVTIEGELQLYNTNNNYAALKYAENSQNQNIIFRKYNDIDNSEVYPIVTIDPSAVGGETKIGETPNGDKPIYISSSGVATACDGIVITPEAQTFSGEKTFNGPINIDIQYSDTSGLIANSDNVYKYLAIKNGDNDYIAIDNKCIQKCGQDTDLHLNPDGGDIFLGYSGSFIDEDGYFECNDIFTYGDIQADGAIYASQFEGDYFKGYLRLLTGKTNATNYCTIKYDDAATGNEVIYIKNYGQSVNTYLAAYASSTGIGNTTTPAYVASDGLIKICSGVVITTGEQNFDGNKNFRGNIFTNGSSTTSWGEKKNGVTFGGKLSSGNVIDDNNNSHSFYLWGNTSSGTRGLWDSYRNSHIIYFNKSGKGTIPQHYGRFIYETTEYGTSLPTTDLTPGQVFFKIIS